MRIYMNDLVKFVNNTLEKYQYYIIDNKKKIFLVCPTKYLTNSGEKGDRFSEFFSLSELEQVLKCFQSLGIYTEVFFETNALFSKLLSLDADKMSDIIVFEHTESNGISAGDSLIPAFCETNGIKHIGPSPYINALLSNKFHWSILLRNYGFDMPESFLYQYQKKWLADCKPQEGELIFIKPNSGYCSIGVDHLSKCHLNQETCDLLDKRVETYQQEFIVQRFIEGVEYEVPFFVDYSGQIHVLPPIRIHHNEQKDYLDFHDVLTDDYTFSIETDSEILSTLNQVVSEAVSFLRFDKFGRIDIRYSQGKAYIFDINTYPHYIEHSSFYKSMHSIYKENTLDIIMKLLLGNLFPDF